MRIEQGLINNIAAELCLGLTYELLTVAATLIMCVYRVLHARSEGCVVVTYLLYVCGGCFNMPRLPSGAMHPLGGQ